MPNFKNARLSEDIKREISGLIRERIKDPRVKDGLVSVVRTELSGDNSHCKVYISHLDGMEASKKCRKGSGKRRVDDKKRNFQQASSEKMPRAEIHCGRLHRAFRRDSKDAREHCGS